MRRILSVALLVTAVGAVAPSHAAKRGHARKALAFTAASQCAASGMVCQGSCPLRTSAALATKSGKALSAKAAACPVSDPWACPLGCPRGHATAVATVATD